MIFLRSAALQNVIGLCERRAQIGLIDTALRAVVPAAVRPVPVVEHLCMAHCDLRSAFAGDPKLFPTGEVLPEIDNSRLPRRQRKFARIRRADNIPITDSAMRRSPATLP